jgi:hypothetical protein
MPRAAFLPRVRLFAANLNAFTERFVIRNEWISSGVDYDFFAARIRRNSSPNCSNETFFSGSSVFTR